MAEYYDNTCLQTVLLFRITQILWKLGCYLLGCGSLLLMPLMKLLWLILNSHQALLTSDSTTTYLSNKYQDLLLYGSLLEAYGYLKGPQNLVQYYQQSYQQALQSYAIEQQGRRRRDEYQDGVIRTPLKSPPPTQD